MHQDDWAEFISASFIRTQKEQQYKVRLPRIVAPCVIGYKSTPRSKRPVHRFAVPLPRVERSTSANHTSLTLVFLGRFPIRPVAQSASSYGLASWTGQQRGRLELWHLSFPRQSGGSGERSEPIGAFMQQSLFYGDSQSIPHIFDLQNDRFILQ